MAVPAVPSVGRPLRSGALSRIRELSDQLELACSEGASPDLKARAALAALACVTDSSRLAMERGMAAYALDSLAGMLSGLSARLRGLELRPLAPGCLE